MQMIGLGELYGAGYGLLTGTESGVRLLVGIANLVQDHYAEDSCCLK